MNVLQVLDKDVHHSIVYKNETIGNSLYVQFNILIKKVTMQSYSIILYYY